MPDSSDSDASRFVPANDRPAVMRDDAALNLTGGGTQNTGLTPPRNPVFLVHGIIDRAYIFNSLRAFLEREGWTVYALDLIPNDGRAGIEVLAQQLAEFIDRQVGRDRPIDVIGFSMGGLVSRYYIQRLGGLDRVDHFISICAPNHGTRLAFLMPLFTGIRQMCPNSEFLNDLNQDAIEQLGQINYTSLWTPSDLMIIPADSARMPIGRNLTIPAKMHAWTVSDARYHAEIAATLLDQVDQTSTPA
jgi:triacylglycerol lipase